MRILITGAGSSIGRVVCRELSEVHEIVPWTSSDANLLSPLSEERRTEAQSVDAVLHLAWVREKSLAAAESKNREMLFTRFVDEAGLDPSKLYLLSSVSGAPAAMSSYAQAKYQVTRDLIERGGTGIVCGLVTSDPPFGPFALFHKMASLPGLRPSFDRGCPGVYPVAQDRLASGIRLVLEEGAPGINYALCDEPVPMNTFVSRIPGAGGLPLPVYTPLLLAAAKLLRGLPPWTLWDKLLTFFYKDADFLAELKPIPGWNK